MTDYDIFNGDADGICALHQLRLTSPSKNILITGLKRDIALVAKVSPKSGDHLTILDVALEKNHTALEAHLNNGITAQYFDHHNPGEALTHPNLDCHIDTSANICTSLIVDRSLDGRQRIWAVVGAFGDNLIEVATHLAESLGCDAQEISLLRELGTYLNYNGYGLAIEDLYFHPTDLYREISQYENPFEFIQHSDAFGVLKEGYQQDMNQAAQTEVEFASDKVALYIIPDETWAKRVSGVWGNDLALQFPHRAHAILTEIPGEGYRVSVRSPMDNKSGADELCLQFPTGGGRKGAAGINLLPTDQYQAFCDAFIQAYP